MVPGVRGSLLNSRNQISEVVFCLDQPVTCLPLGNFASDKEMKTLSNSIKLIVHGAAIRTAVPLQATKSHTISTLLDTLTHLQDQQRVSLIIRCVKVAGRLRDNQRCQKSFTTNRSGRKRRCVFLRLYVRESSKMNTSS
jgi:hypothetical protein